MFCEKLTSLTHTDLYLFYFIFFYSLGIKLRLYISDMLISERNILWLNILNVFISRQGIVSLPNLVLRLYLQANSPVDT